MWWKRKLGFEVNIFFKATSNMSSLLFLVTKLNFYNFIVIRFVFLVKYSRGWLWCRYSCNSRIYENVVNKAKKWISKWVLQENKAPQIFRKANTVAGLRPRAQGSGLWHRCFPLNFAKFLGITFLQNTSGRLFLYPDDHLSTHGIEILLNIKFFNGMLMVISLVSFSHISNKSSHENKKALSPFYHKNIF